MADAENGDGGFFWPAEDRAVGLLFGDAAALKGLVRGSRTSHWGAYMETHPQPYVRFCEEVYEL